MLKELDEILHYFTFNFITTEGNYNITLDMEIFNSICDDYYLEYDLFDVKNYKFKTFKEFQEYQNDIKEFKQKYNYKTPTQYEIKDIVELIFGDCKLIKFNIFDSYDYKNINIIFKPLIKNDNLSRLIYNY